jgi:hypothetical protein
MWFKYMQTLNKRKTTRKRQISFHLTVFKKKKKRKKEGKKERKKERKERKKTRRGMCNASPLSHSS